MSTISFTKRAIGILMALALLLMVFVEPLGVRAESDRAEVMSKSTSKVQVTYKNRIRTYYHALKKVYVNRKKKSLSKYPIFKKSGTYMGPAEILFGNGELGTAYDGNSKRVAIRLNNTLIIMHNGKKKAYVNGKKRSLGAPAMLVNYKKSGKTMWVVPIKSVCNILGLDYHLIKGNILITKATDQESSSDTTETETATAPANNVPSQKIIVCLDAGHGGSDSGASAYGFIEKNMNLAIVLAAKRYFDQDPHFQVYYTRLTDVLPSLNARCAFANQKNADFFISVHINSYKKTSSGTETLYNASRVQKTAKNGLNSYELASWMQTWAATATGFGNRGLVNRPKLIVLKNTKMPACLIEYGFISNPSEAKRMNMNLGNYGLALYNGVVALMKNKGRYR